MRILWLILAALVAAVAPQPLRTARKTVLDGYQSVPVNWTISSPRKARVLRSGVKGDRRRAMMSRLVGRALILACVALGLPSVRAEAQQIDLVGAVTNSFLQGDYDTRHYVGWLGAAAFRLTDVVSIVAEGSGDYAGDAYDDSFRFYTLVAGPRFTSPTGRARPFFQVPIGLVHSRTIFRGVAPLSYSNNTFLVAPGGGVEFWISDHAAARFQADWLVIAAQYSEAWHMHNVRFVTGVTYRR